MTNPNDTAEFPSHNDKYDCWCGLGKLTKREYFSAMAMQGLISQMVDETNIAKCAIKQADALIAALSKEEK